MDDVLVKPFKRPDIEAMLQKWAQDMDTVEPKSQGEEVAEAEELEEIEELEEVEEADETKVTEEAKDTGEIKKPGNTKDAGPEDTWGILDESNLVETFFGNKEVVSSLLGRFIERTEQEIALIPALIEKEDWETAQREAHTIKGSSLNLSARQLGEAAAQLELAIKNRDTQAISVALPLLSPAFIKFRQAAQRFIQAQTKGA
jgi:HPt (histidine-containing phosphotransfer) domain-containing protein